MKLLRKKNGQWFTIAAATLAFAVAPPSASAVFAEATAQEENIHVDKELQLSQFMNKSKFLEEERLKEYITETLLTYDKRKNHINTKEEIQEEIRKQIELDLPAYVVQPGDTLSNIADALVISYEELYDANEFEGDIVKLMTGDILDGVLDNLHKAFATTPSSPTISRQPIIPQRQNTTMLLRHQPSTQEQSTPMAEEQVEVKENIPSESIETPEVPEEPETPDVPEEPETPEVPEKPETPDVPEEPETPEVPEEPETPEVPEEPETPEAPEEPETPDVPEEPETPELPEDVHGEIVETEVKEFPAPEEPIIQENPDRLVGEEEVLQDAQPGKVEVTTITPTLNGEPSGEPVVSERVIEDPKPQIIEIGTGIIYEETTIVTKEIPAPETPIVQEDNNLPEGQERVIQEAMPGVLEIKTTTPMLNGKPYGEITTTEQIVHEPKPQIVEIGTGVLGENVSTQTKDLPVPNEPIFKENPNRPEGEEEILQTARPGRVKITTTTPTLNGEPYGDSVVTEEVIQAPQPEVIEIGTGILRTVTRTEVETIPAPEEAIIQENSDLPEGEERIIQEAIPGSLKIVTHIPMLNDEPYGESTTTREVIQEAQPQIIEVGSGVLDEVVNIEMKELPAPEESVIQENNHLPEGQKRTLQEAKPGTIEVTTTTPTLNGEPYGEPIISERVVQEAQPKVVEIGTGVLGEDVVVEVKELPIPEPILKENNELPEGEHRIIQEATPGQLEITTTTPTLNGEPYGEPVVTETILKESQPEIIEVGTGVVGEDISTEVKELPAPNEPIVQENPDLPEGEERILQDARPGEVEITTTIKTLNGSPIGESVVSEKIILEPTPQIIEIGTGVLGEDVSVEIHDIDPPAEPVIQENPNIPEGEERILQEAKPGRVEITITTPTLNGEPYGDPVETQKVLEEPTPKTIEVGTGVMDEAVTTEIEEIPAGSPEQRENPNLPQGEERIVQEGAPGKKKVTITQPTLNGEPYSEPTVVEETIEEPQLGIVEVGTGVVSDEVKTDVIQLPFDTKRVENSNLPEGEERVTQTGVVGEKVITTTTPTLNGEPYGEPTVMEEITQEPVDHIIEVGTGVVGEETHVETITLPFETETRENPNLSEGEENTIQDGVDGEKIITTTTPTLNGKPNGEPSVTEETTRQPVTQIVEIGTGVVGEDVVTEIKEITAPEPIIQENSNLPEGEERIIQEAVPGKVEITTTTPTLNGEPNGKPTVTEKVLEEAKPQIIEVGTGVLGEEVTTRRRSIPFDTERRENKDVPRGQSKVVQEGRAGELTITTTTPTLNGEPYGEPVETEEVTREPVTHTIEVGTGITSQKTIRHTKVIPFETITRENPNLPEGEERIVQVGQSGQLIETHTTPTFNGEPSGETVITTEITEDPVTHIVEIGTGVVGEDVQVENHTLPFDTEVRENSDRPEGEEEILQEGVNGQKVVTTTTPTLNGEPYGESVVTEEVIREPVTQIIEVGTGRVGESVTRSTYEIPFDIERRENSGLPEGAERIVQEGQLGEKVVTRTTPTLNGKLNGETVITEEITKEPVTHIIEVGTGVIGEEVKETTQLIPFETVTRETPNLPEGEERIIQEGQEGEKVIIHTTPTFNGEPSGVPVITERIVKRPVNKLIEIGRGVLGTDVSQETIDIPFVVERRENPDRPDGEQHVIQKGQPGKKIVTTTTPTLNGMLYGDPEVTEEVTEEPVTHIIEVGTGEIEEESVTMMLETPAPEEPIYRKNPDRPKGEEEVIQESQPEIIEVTITTRTFKGEPYGDEIVTEKVIQEMKPTIIEIGTYVPDVTSFRQRKEVEVIPFNTKIIRDNTLYTNQEIVETEGVQGSVTTIYTDKYVNNELVSSELISQETVEPVDAVIRVGTKTPYDHAEGLKVGDTVLVYENKASGHKEYGTVTEVDINDIRNPEEMAVLSPDELYKIASDNSQRNNIVYLDGLYYRIPFSEQGLEEINYYFDYTAFNLEFMKLLNAERTSQGLNRVAYSPVLYHELSSVRSQQTADNGRIHFYDQNGNQISHVTRDLKPGESAHTEEIKPNYIIRDSNYVGYTGENVASNQHLRYLAQYLSPRYQAEIFFNQWYNSAGHYNNMMYPNMTYFAVATKPSSHTRYSKDEYSYIHNGSYATFSFSGYGANGTPYEFINDQNIETIDGIDMYILRHQDGTVLGYLPVDDSDLDTMIERSMDYHLEEQKNAPRTNAASLMPEEIHSEVTFEDAKNVLEEENDDDIVDSDDSEQNIIFYDETEEDQGKLDDDLDDLSEEDDDDTDEEDDRIILFNETEDTEEEDVEEEENVDEDASTLDEEALDPNYQIELEDDDALEEE